jgi:hypothetical protein
MSDAGGPFFTYFGGKYRAAPHYPKPQYKRVVEAFAGSAGYALRYSDREVTLCEANPVIAGIWRWLIKAPEADLLALPDVPAGASLRDFALPDDARAFVGMWMNKGMTGPCWTPSTWLHSGIRPNSSWGPTLRARLANRLKYIRHWQVVDDFRSAPVLDATWFVDPPYEGRLGRRYNAHDIDYSKLADWCRTRPGQTIVCENEGADWLPFIPFRSIKGTEGSGRTGVSKEAIWTGNFLRSA